MPDVPHDQTRAIAMGAYANKTRNLSLTKCPFCGKSVVHADMVEHQQVRCAARRKAFGAISSRNAVGALRKKGKGGRMLYLDKADHNSVRPQQSATVGLLPSQGRLTELSSGDSRFTEVMALVNEGMSQLRRCLEGTVFRIQDVVLKVTQLIEDEWTSKVWISIRKTQGGVTSHSRIPLEQFAEALESSATREFLLETSSDLMHLKSLQRQYSPSHPESHQKQLHDAILRTRARLIKSMRQSLLGR